MNVEFLRRARLNVRYDITEKIYTLKPTYTHSNKRVTKTGCLMHHNIQLHDMSLCSSYRSRLQSSLEIVLLLAVFWSYFDCGSAPHSALISPDCGNVQLGFLKVYLHKI